MVYIKIPKAIRHYEYQCIGDEGYQYMAEVMVGGVYKKEDKSIAQNYVFLAVDSIQHLFFQLKIYMEDNKVIQYHEFIDIAELYKEIKPNVPLAQNVKMEIKEVKEENVKEEEEEEEEEEETSDEEEEVDAESMNL